MLSSNRGYGGITQCQSGNVGETAITGSFRNVFAFCLYHPTAPISAQAGAVLWAGRLWRREKQYMEQNKIDAKFHLCSLQLVIL